jgi:hypothetical protein
VLTGAGWSVVMPEKGRNHLLALDPPYAALGHVSSDEDQFFRRTSSDPTHCSSCTYRRDDHDGDRIFAAK